MGNLKLRIKSFSGYYSNLQKRIKDWTTDEVTILNISFKKLKPEGGRIPFIAYVVYKSIL